MTSEEIAAVILRSYGFGGINPETHVTISIHKLTTMLEDAVVGDRDLHGRRISGDRVMTTQRERGYREALEEIANLAVSGKTRDEALLIIEERLERAGIVREWIGS